MRLKSLTLLVIISLFFLGCATTQHCPPEDIVYIIVFPDGSRPAGIPKGFLDKDKEGSNWMSKEDYDALRNEPKKQSSEAVEEINTVLGI